MKENNSGLFLLLGIFIFPFISFSQNPTFKVAGKVYETDSKKPILNATIELFGSDGTDLVTKVDSLGYYYYDTTKVKGNVKYKISASSEGYLTKYAEFTTTNLAASKDFIFDFDFPEQHGCTMFLIHDDYNVTFDFKSDKLSNRFKKELDDFIQILSENPTLTIQIQGFVDEEEITKKDTLLPFKRAKAVYNYMVMKGVNNKRLYCINSYSKAPFEIYRYDSNFKKGTILNNVFIENLATIDEKNKAHQLNRRVEFKIKDTNFPEQ